MNILKSELKQWIAAHIPVTYEIKALKGDASFRNYYRIFTPKQSYILMLAPPSKERTDSFVAIARQWRACDLMVPEILAWQPDEGWVLLTDFGDTLLAEMLTSQSMEHYYQLAINILYKLQKNTDKESLPLFDEAHIQFELSLFAEWFLSSLLGYKLTAAQEQLLRKINTKLVKNCLVQPQVTIHRDYHCRNLMVLNNPFMLGIIDFQDAMQGPMTYDLVSLLKDCYVTWPRSQILILANQFADKLAQEGKLKISFDTFLEWFDWTGLQRHLKVLGVFARLNLRDNKSHYLKDIPRVLSYVLETTALYPYFAEFNDFLQNEVITHWQQFIEQSIKVA